MEDKYNSSGRREVFEHRMLLNVTTSVSYKPTMIEIWSFLCTNLAFFKHVITSGGSELETVGLVVPPEGW